MVVSLSCVFTGSPNDWNRRIKTSTMVQQRKCFSHKNFLNVIQPPSLFLPTFPKKSQASKTMTSHAPPLRISKTLTDLPQRTPSQNHILPQPPRSLIPSQKSQTPAKESLRCLASTPTSFATPAVPVPMLYLQSAG